MEEVLAGLTHPGMQLVLAISRPAVMVSRDYQI